MACVSSLSLSFPLGEKAQAAGKEGSDVGVMPCGAADPLLLRRIWAATQEAKAFILQTGSLLTMKGGVMRN